MSGPPRRATAVAVTVLSVLLGLLFVFAGATKLAGQQMHVEHFAAWGYPDWFRVVVGGIELAGGLALFVPSLAFYGAAGLAVDMVGAVYTELFRGDPPRAIFPFTVCLLLIGVALVRRRAALDAPRPRPAV